LKLSGGEPVNISYLNALENLEVLELLTCVADVSQLIPHIRALPNLRSLNLTNNQISDISSITTLEKLTYLSLLSNQIEDASPISKLPNLVSVNLGRNKISNASALKDMKKLNNLWLVGNEIQDATPIEDLTNLTSLSLGANGLENIYPLMNLRKLRTLHLQENYISDLSPLRNLHNLITLSLKDNKIKDITPLRDLKKLRTLRLQKNPLTEIPQWITQFSMEIKWEEYGPQDGFLTFFDNPLKSPPPEIVKAGKEAIKNYFDQVQEQDTDYLFEAKMLIVGEPGAGKTTLACKIENPNCEMPKEEDTTKGIDVKQYYFPLQKDDFPTFSHPEKLENRNFRLNLWDFGGQQIYKATHRFFLSKRSLYALVADSRNENTDFNYWLHIIEMFGGESPLLIILNEKYNRKRNLDVLAMRNRFNNISEVLDVDFAEEDKTRIYRLQKAVKYYVSQLQHIGSPVPAKWTIVRENLEKDIRNTISLQDYVKICQDNGITKIDDALLLSQYFHDIGVFLHFQDDELLKKTIFLKPNWATNSVYKILDHELLNKNKGRFNKADAKEIWFKDEFEFIRDELLRLMQKFFLTYEIEDSRNYIVPERLQETPPEYLWDKKYNLLLQYKYDLFMPKGILSQFIVQMNRYITNHEYVWKRGVILQRDNTNAEVLESYDARSISIRISGKNRRDFMTIITEQFDQINAQYEKMKVEKLIPCYCGECKSSHRPYFFEYADLKRRLEKGREEIECGQSYEMVNVHRLIDEVINEDKIKLNVAEITSQDNDIHLEWVKRNGLFISYSHKDKNWLAKVQAHIKVLAKIGIVVNLWDDTQIKAGMKWREEIEKALSIAKVAILLVSTDFLNSDFINKDEIPRLLKAAQEDGATILPLIIRPSLYTTHPSLRDYQAVNDPSKPLSKLSRPEQDEVLVSMTQRIMELMK
jgi:GTPase SAR1 family protein